MNKLFSIALIMLSLSCFCQDKSFEVVNSFYQGKANNCASIALIKAAMDKYGYKNVYQLKKERDQYVIVLRDNTELTISQEEFDLAKETSKFEKSKTNLTKR